MIYFVQPTEGGPIKIGHSANVPARIKQLEAHYGKPLAVLATMEGGREEEVEIHARFGHLRHGRTEQFRPSQDLMEFIGRPLLVGLNPNLVESMPSVSGVPIIVLKGSRQYRDWLASVSKDSLIPVASIVRDAVAKWAVQRGYKEPPER